MDREEDRLLSESIGQILSVFYNDTLNTVSFKVGRILDFDRFSIKIQEEGRESPTLIPRGKLIRIEFGGEKSIAHSRKTF